MVIALLPGILFKNRRKISNLPPHFHKILLARLFTGNPKKRPLSLAHPAGPPIQPLVHQANSPFFRRAGDACFLVSPGCG
ncbi:MAG: hypothetical protein AAGF97_19355, partial [Planctomycetota bacterium]